MNTQYREAVTANRPGLPRFAATLGQEVRMGNNPIGVVPPFPVQEIVVTPLGYLGPFHDIGSQGSRNAGNPGLYSITASR